MIVVILKMFVTLDDLQSWAIFCDFYPYWHVTTKKKNLGKFDEVFTSGKIKCHKTLDVYIYMVIICSGI